VIHSSTLENISTKRIIDWMNVIREESGDVQYSILESFWASQLLSKSWLINVAKDKLQLGGSIYICAGWYGVLAQMMSDNFNNVLITSIDIDPSCKQIGERLSGYDTRINFITDDITKYTQYMPNTSCIINTAVEHLTESAYKTWLNNLPRGIPIILQGNDYTEVTDHINTANSIDEFKERVKLNNISYEGSLDCGQFNRFMVIGTK
jgi:hypothetical protein